VSLTVPARKTHLDGRAIALLLVSRRQQRN
jgi:hypothetical protein